MCVQFGVAVTILVVIRVRGVGLRDHPAFSLLLSTPPPALKLSHAGPARGPHLVPDL